MKIILFSRSRVNHNPSDLRLILSLIERYGFSYCVNEEFSQTIEELIGVAIPSQQIYGSKVETQEPASESIMICYGGDGTLLEGVQRLGGQPIVVAGINSGRLGFLTSVSRSGIEHLFELIANGKLRSQKRIQLNVEGDFAPNASHLATNEFTVQRSGASMISVDTYVSGELVATYYGDGVIVSTPTGSTAYSLSAGGPILAPACGCWVISPIAPHNLTMRPVVVPATSPIELRIRMREGDAFVSVDNLKFPIESQSKVQLTLAKESLYLALPDNTSFYETLRNKMMWGVDMR